MPRVKRNIQDRYNSPFAKRLRDLLKEKNITQNQLSKIIGKTRQAVNNYTLGNTAPDSDTLIKLSEYFNVSADYLLGISDVKTTDKDIAYICEYTGLCEETIEKLHKENNYYSNGIHMLNNLLTDDVMYKMLSNICSLFFEYDNYVDLCSEIIYFDTKTDNFIDICNFLDMCDNEYSFREKSDFEHFQISRQFEKLIEKLIQKYHNSLNVLQEQVTEKIKNNFENFYEEYCLEKHKYGNKSVKDIVSEYSIQDDDLPF